jgi:hypothetical protein
MQVSHHTTDRIHTESRRNYYTYALAFIGSVREVAEFVSENSAKVAQNPYLR